MNKKYGVKIIGLLVSSLSFFSYAASETKVTTRGAFFDAEPPSYLSPFVEEESLNITPLSVNKNSENEENQALVPLSTLSESVSEVEQKVINDSYFNHKQESSRSVSNNVVSMQDAARMIVIYHPLMAQVRGNEKSEAEMINVAKSAYYPEIRGGLGMKYDRSTTYQDDRKYTPSADIEINQTIYDFGKTANSVKSAEYGHLGAKAYSSATNEELIHTAVSDVVAIVRGEKLIKLAQQQVIQVKSLGKLVAERHGKGASNLSDVFQAESRIDDVESIELDTQAQYESILRNLGIIIGMPHISGAEIGALPAELGKACSILSDWEQVPEYAIADLEAKRAQAEFEYSKSNELPTISLQGNVSRPFNNSSRRGTRNDTRISLNISVPFYEGGRLEASKRAASNRKQSAEARKEEVRLEVNQALSQLQVSLQNMEKRQSLLVRRVENLRGTKELYKKQYVDLGTRTLIDLLNSEQEFHQAQVDVAINQSNILQAQLDCAFYQGKLRSYFNISEP